MSFLRLPPGIVDVSFPLRFWFYINVVFDAVMFGLVWYSRPLGRLQDDKDLGIDLFLLFGMILGVTLLVMTVMCWKRLVKIERILGVALGLLSLGNFVLFALLRPDLNIF